MATIRTAADKIQATVSAFGKVKESQFNEGSYQSVLFEAPELPDGKVWRSMTPDQAQSLNRGQTVYLVPTTNKQGKPSYDIELLPTIAPTAPAATTQAPTQGKPATQGTSLDAMTGEDKQAIASYITSVSALYAFCYQQAAHHLSPHGAPEPAIQAAASTTFIQAARKFSL
jgi:cell wall-associated NlpC family hydrolase